MYLQITRGSAIRNHYFPQPPAPSNVSATIRPAAASGSTQPGKLLMMRDERWANAYIKTINLLPNIIAKQTAHDAGADEALLVRDGKMIESASSNLFFVKDGHFITAPTDRFILPGITRRLVLELASSLGIPVEERKVPVAELSSMDGIFITGTGSEVFPIDTVLSHPSLDVEGDMPEVSPHPIVLQPNSCSVIWRAASLELVERLREAYREKVRGPRS